MNEPVSMLIYRRFSPEGRARALTVDFMAELEISIRKGYPVHVEKDGRVAAAAIIYPPGVYPLPTFDQWTIVIKSILGHGWYDVRSWMRWLNAADRLHPGAAHYYLPCIGVDPDCQGTGLGSAILAHLAAKADQENVGCYLENANPRNLPLYQRFGFQVVNELDVIGIHNWFMWRDPS